MSQDLKKELQAHSWYWVGDINDTIPINLYSLKPDSFNYITKFSDSNRLLLNSPEKNTIDSVFSYIINKNFLAIGYELKDSLISISYRATFSDDKKRIVLQLDSKIKAVYPGRDTITSDYFWLIKQRRTRDVFSGDNIIVYSKLSKSSSITQRIRGDFYRIRGDSLFIDTANFAKNHFFMTGRDTTPPILKVVELHNITKFYHERETFNTLTGLGIGLSALSALIVSPLVCIQKSGFNSDRYFKVAGSSLAAATLFISLRIGFPYKKMVIKNRRNSWRFS